MGVYWCLVSVLSVLFAVVDHDVDLRVGFAEACGELLGAVDGAVLAAGAAEGDGEVLEVAFEVFVDTLADDSFCEVEEAVDGRFALQEFYHGAVFAGVCLVLGEATGVWQGTAVENVAAAVAGGVGGQSLLVTEALDGDGQGGEWSVEG